MFAAAVPKVVPPVFPLPVFPASSSLLSSFLSLPAILCCLHLSCIVCPCVLLGGFSILLLFIFSVIVFFPSHLLTFSTSFPFSSFYSRGSSSRAKIGSTIKKKKARYSLKKPGTYRLHSLASSLSHYLIPYSFLFSSVYNNIVFFLPFELFILFYFSVYLSSPIPFRFLSSGFSLVPSSFFYSFTSCTILFLLPFRLSLVYCIFPQLYPFSSFSPQVFLYFFVFCSLVFLLPSCLSPLVSFSSSVLSLPILKFSSGTFRFPLLFCLLLTGLPPPLLSSSGPSPFFSSCLSLSHHPPYPATPSSCLCLFLLCCLRLCLFHLPQPCLSCS